MRASLDTNVIIHFYRAGLQNILFDFFDEGVFIYEQIRNVELQNHGNDILNLVDRDIAEVFFYFVINISQPKVHSAAVQS